MPADPVDVHTSSTQRLDEAGRVALERRHEPGRETDGQHRTPRESRPPGEDGRDRGAARTRRTRAQPLRAGAPGSPPRPAPRSSRRGSRPRESSGPPRSRACRCARRTGSARRPRGPRPASRSGRSSAARVGPSGRPRTARRRSLRRPSPARRSVRPRRARRGGRLPGPGSWHLVAVAEAVGVFRERLCVAGEDESDRRAGIARIAERSRESVGAIHCVKDIRVLGSRVRERRDGCGVQQATDRAGACSLARRVPDRDGARRGPRSRAGTARGTRRRPPARASAPRQDRKSHHSTSPACRR